MLILSRSVDTRNEREPCVSHTHLKPPRVPVPVPGPAAAATLFSNRVSASSPKYPLSRIKMLSGCVATRFPFPRIGPRRFAQSAPRTPTRTHAYTPLVDASRPRRRSRVTKKSVMSERRGASTSRSEPASSKINEAMGCVNVTHFRVSLVGT